MDMTGPERNTLAKTLWEFVQYLRLPALFSGAEQFLYLTGLTVRTNSLSIIPLKVTTLTRNITNLQVRRCFEPIRSGYGM